MENVEKENLLPRPEIEPVSCLARNIERVYFSKPMGTCTLKDNGKVCPRTGHEGPEWEEMYSSTIPLTTAIEGE